jgi:hypothetical protein
MQVLHKLVNFFVALAGVVLKQLGGVKRFAVISFAGFVVAGFRRAGSKRERWKTGRK